MTSGSAAAQRRAVHDVSAAWRPCDVIAVRAAGTRCLMVVIVMLPFLIGGVLMIVFRDRIAAMFKLDRAFYATLLGEERARRLEDTHGPRLQRFDESWLPRFLLFFGVCWIVISLTVLLGPLLGLG